MVNLTIIAYTSAMAIANWRRRRAFALWFLFVSLSAFGGTLAGRVATFTYLSDVVFVVYSLAILHGLGRFWLRPLRPAENELEPSLLWESLIIGVSLLLILPINVWVVIQSWLYIGTGSVDMTAFKNAGEADFFLRSLVGNEVLQLIRVISPLGFLAISLALLHLIAGRAKWSLFMFLGTLNVPLVGLHSMSRSMATAYTIVMVFLLYLYRSRLDLRRARKVLVPLGMILVVAVAVLISVSVARFAEMDYYRVAVRPETGVLADPTLFAAADYFGQWVENGPQVVRTVDLPLLGMGRSFSTLLDYWGIRTGTSWADYRVAVLGPLATSFLGLPALLLLDLGVAGAGVLALVLSGWVAMRSSPARAGIADLVWRPLGVMIVAMFFTNNFATYKEVQVAAVYGVLFLVWVKVRPRRGRDILKEEF